MVGDATDPRHDGEGVLDDAHVSRDGAEAVARLLAPRLRARAADHDREASFPHESVAELRTMG